MKQLKGNDFYHDSKLLAELYPEYYIGTWAPEDFRTFAEDLTDDECIDVSQLIEKYHDAGIGVNWDVIEYHVGNVVNNRSLKTD